MWADIVVFDPKKIIDKATYQNPHQYPDGIEYVVVNGQVSVEQGKNTGVLAGRTLRKTV
jgi:N-acyl-D-aspartate/D-glutamate deacylase